MTTRHVGKSVARPQSIVLGSSSPQRLSLLRQILPYHEILVRSADVDEAKYHEVGPKKRCQLLSQDKLIAVKNRYSQDCFSAITIAADTELIYDDMPLGKPATETEARAMLDKLRGSEIQVFTGLSMSQTSIGKQVSVVSETTVRFIAFSKALLDSYIRSGEWQGKSGGYAIQGLGVMLTDGIDGSYSNVVGLPLETLSRVLVADFGFNF